MYEVNRTQDLLAALSDADRLRVVRALLKRGQASGSELGAIAGISQSTCARHLKELEACGLIFRARRKQPYRLFDPDGTRALLQAASHLARETLGHASELEEFFRRELDEDGSEPDQSAEMPR